jgi:PAS domain S-box-containing protein
MSTDTGPAVDRLLLPEALRRSEARYRALAEAASQAVWVWDPATGSGDFDATQRWWEEVTGQSPADQSAREYQGWLDRVHPEDREQARAAWVGALASGIPYEIEYRILARTGEVRVVQARAVAVRGPEGEVREWVGTLSDVTERRSVEEALKEADRRKDEFLAMLAHELRNPLAPIRNAAEVLRRTGGADPYLEQARSMIERQVAHMARLVDDLLDVSRISRSKILLRKERLDLALLVRATTEDHRSLLEEAGLTLAVEVPPEPVWMSGDPTRLSQILDNLLQNAAKFSNPGGRVSVRLACDPEGLAVLAVEDTGIGMEPDILARLFQPFSQADRSLDRSQGGLGLGLALVKGLVDLHGGQVEAASGGTGQGSRFTIRLPLAQEEMPAAPPEPAAPAAPRSLSILVVEDNRDAAESLQMLLELSGHQVVVAHTGQSGLEAALRVRPDVALCDIGLPGGMDGYALARALRAAEETAGIVLIALTGYGQDEDKRQARESGYDQHMTKPVNPATLMSLLQTLASRP